MLENISKLGSLLSKDQQKAIQGGDAYCVGGCAGKNEGDHCYTASGGCRTRISGICQFFGGQLACNGGAG